MSSHRFLLRRVWHLAIPTPLAMGYSPTEYAEFTEPPAEMFSHGFLLRRVWHLAIPTPPAMGYSPTEYAEFTEPPAEMSSHGFLLRRVCHLAIPTPPAMGYSPTEYAEFTEPPAEMSSHGFHRFTQMLRVRCSPTECTEYTELGSVGMAGMPYPPTSVRIRAHLWEVLLCQKFPCVLWEYLFSHGFHRFTQILRVRCSPTEYAEFTEFVSVCIAGMPYPPTSVRIRAHLWEVLLCQKFPCVPCVLWDYLFSHGFHRFTQMLRVRCSPTECTEYTELGSVGMAGMPYPPTSVRIRVICGSPFSARGSVYSVYSVGASSPFVRLVQQRLLHPLAESTEVVCKSHPFTSNPAFCMSSQYCGYDFVTTCGSLMRSPGNTIAAGANAIAMRWSS